jgi:hypothetical protein
LTNVYPNKNNKNNKVKSKPLELYELVGQKTFSPPAENLSIKVKLLLLQMIKKCFLKLMISSLGVNPGENPRQFVSFGPLKIN